MIPQAAKGGRPPQFVKNPFCVGKIRYADGTTGTLIHVKAGVPTNAPLSISDNFAEQHPNFPCDSTLDQLYDADRFDVYRELGVFCVGQAVKGYPAAKKVLDSQSRANRAIQALGGCAHSTARDHQLATVPAARARSGACGSNGARRFGNQPPDKRRGSAGSARF